MIRENIKESIQKALKIEFKLELDDIKLISPEPQFGDFSLACHFLARDLKMPPQEIAEKLAKSLKGKLITKAEAVSGYLNIIVDAGAMSKEVLSDVIVKNEKYGWTSNVKQKIVNEYSSPNTNKPLHLGHIRNKVLGMSIARMFESQGAGVKKVQLINDRGIHIMKSMVAYQKNGNIAVVTMARPEDMNALNEDVMQQLDAKFTAADADAEVETIFITGLGKAFVAGADIRFFVKNMKARSEEHTSELQSH